MRVQLLSKPDNTLSPRVQVLLNRGMQPKEIPTYLNSSMAEVADPSAFGEDLLRQGARMLMNHVAKEDTAFIVVDSDVDGMTSAAILINYLYDVFPSWVENKLEWGFHEGKQHGLNDFIDTLEDCGYGLVICPDSGTGDADEVRRLQERGTDVLILDHHPFDEKANTIIINSQYDYPNPQLSGAGVVWQFCRFLDTLGGNDYAKDYIDLCALGLQADMMDLRATETKSLIFEGCRDVNIKNPLMRSAIEKNEYSFNKADYKPSQDNNLLVSPMGLSFFLIPLMNAICRSGTMEEKELVFDSMLKFRAFIIVPSTKRGHKLGETERKLDQALRTLTNVKNRQTRAETAAIELFENKIQNENLLDNKVLLILTEPGAVDRNVAGLVANKLMSKYQRPTCVLTKVERDGEVTYQGSMRGYTRTGVSDFASICRGARGCAWIRGHENAAGACLRANEIDDFISDTNAALGSISADPIYYVDYMFQSDDINPDTVLSLAAMNDYLGTGIERPLIYIKDLYVDDNNIAVYKGNTLKISTPSNIDIMQFGAEDELIEHLREGVLLDVVCRCNENVWNWNRNPQLIIEGFEEKEQEKKEEDVLSSWGF